MATPDPDPLQVPELDPAVFSDNVFLSFDDEGFDITFDDLFQSDPSLDPIQCYPADPESDFVPNDVVLEESDNQCVDVSGFLNYSSPESGNDVVQLPDDSGGVKLVPRVLNFDSTNEAVDVPRVLSCDSPEDVKVPVVLNCLSSDSENRIPASSQGSGNYSGSNSADNDEIVVDQMVKSEDSGNNSNTNNADPSVSNDNCVLKRKNENSGDVSSDVTRCSKYRRSEVCEEDEKKKARLIRNRESAQLSRQRKKHYVEELEDKVRAMHATIQDLNAKISYIAAENVSLRQQMVATNGGGAGASCQPPMMYPHPAMAPMPYPWMPCPPYVVQPQGSQTPVVPIPRLKPQKQFASVSKSKKVEGKKTEGKTKKVASVSFLGLLFFIMLFGGLVPMVNVKYGNIREAYVGGSDYSYRGLSDQRLGRVLPVNGHLNGSHTSTNSSHNVGIGLNKEKVGFVNGRAHGEDPNSKQNEHSSPHLPNSDKFGPLGNGSEPLAASLYVPRNDKLVKIDGNLIIHSVLASEKAMASQQEPKSSKETSLAVALDLSPAIPSPGVGQSNGRNSHLYRQRALTSEEGNLKSKGEDGKLQQWFREGLAGPMLSSGMCTEVFQFDISAAIVPATSVENVTTEHAPNSTYSSKGRNRRILHGLPIPVPGPANNITKQRVGGDSDDKSSQKSNSTMVVSVLVDPREAGDGDGDGVMGKKSFSRIFVVVLLDSVKYVTYSCMLPLKGSALVV